MESLKRDGPVDIRKQTINREDEVVVEKEETVVVEEQGVPESSCALPGAVGIVGGFNPNGILMVSFTGADAIGDAIVSPHLQIVRIGPGLYTEDIRTTSDGLTFEAVEGQRDATRLAGDWTVIHNDITFKDITFTGKVIVQGERVRFISWLS